MTRPRVYLEEDCPVAELSVESQRERGASSALPPLYFLHVWWARRPLTVSRASVLGSLLPADFPRGDFLRLMGIPKGADPVASRKVIDEVKAGIRKDRVKDPYGYPRAFKHNLSTKEQEQVRAACKALWGTERPVVLDSFAGGGSIPFEAYRMGFDVILNELNPVASIIERATIEYPAKFGPALAKDIEQWGSKIATKVEAELADCFPRKAGEKDLCYIWVRTVACPQCELEVPLSPNWWLDKGNKLAFALQVPAKPDKTCKFKVVHKSADFDPDAGTVTRGVGRCPRCTTVLESDHIKIEAQGGRLGHQLGVVGFRLDNKNGRFFREVSPEDLVGVEKARRMLSERIVSWDARGLVPTELIPDGNKTREPLNKGILRWCDLFNPRQLLVHLTTLDTILSQPWSEIRDQARREAVRVYLAFAFDKGCDYNSIQTRMHNKNLRMVNTFDRHDFAFSWSYGEIDGAGQLWRWGVSQAAKAPRELAELLGSPPGASTFHVGDAASLKVGDKSIHNISIDPPYYDNVMYAELSDFFYVWMKRTLGDVFPDLLSNSLTEKDAEVVANVARFSSAARGKARGLADQDYTAKMLASFRECHRVLRDDGVLTIMFTHKRLDAWDSLGRALVEAGFEITATWPVHTESEHSLHQAKKNAAASTIILVCRKRPDNAAGAWWEDIEHELRAHVRERAEKFASMGLRGQDTSIASFGPALQVISRQWPVKRKDGTVISPDEALDIAREEVMEWMFKRIADGHVKAVDKWTRFYILAWFVFGAREFPYDEARKLALSVKVDITKELIPRKLLEKKKNTNYVRLLLPGERFKTGGLDPAKKEYGWDVDYVHAAIHAYETGLGAELARFHQRTEALRRDGYKHAVGYLLDVLPRVKEVTEYHALDKLWEGNLQDDVKRRAPRTTDPTFEKQQRLEVTTDVDGDSFDEGDEENAEEDDE